VGKILRIGRDLFFNKKFCEFALPGKSLKGKFLSFRSYVISILKKMKEVYNGNKRLRKVEMEPKN